jgi:hypothetical protein
MSFVKLIFDIIWDICGFIWAQNKCKILDIQWRAFQKKLWRYFLHKVASLADIEIPVGNIVWFLYLKFCSDMHFFEASGNPNPASCVFSEIDRPRRLDKNASQI